MVQMIYTYLLIYSHLGDDGVEKPENPVNEEDLEDYDDEETDKEIELVREEKALSDINTTPNNSMAEEAARGCNGEKSIKEVEQLLV
jgi:hypothetical protein